MFPEFLNSNDETEGNDTKTRCTCGKTLPKWLAHLLNVLVTEKVKRAQENVAASIVRTKIMLPLRERGN